MDGRYPGIKEIGMLHLIIHFYYNQDKYDNPIDVMSAQANQKTPGSLMFQTMFKYIVGANKGLVFYKNIFRNFS